jgi:hypothetical protein
MIASMSTPRGVTTGTLLHDGNLFIMICVWSRVTFSSYEKLSMPIFRLEFGMLSSTYSMTWPRTRTWSSFPSFSHARDRFGAVLLYYDPQLRCSMGHHDRIILPPTCVLVAGNDSTTIEAYLTRAHIDQLSMRLSPSKYRAAAGR